MRARRFVVLCLVISGSALASGCDGGASRPRVAAEAPDAAPDAPMDVSQDDARPMLDLRPPTMERDADNFIDARVLGDLPAQDLPADAAPPLKIVPGNVRLIGWGRSSCTHQVPASGNGDRWCGFRRPGATPEQAELWVINISAAARGTPPVCDGSSPDCLKLSDALWTAEVLLGPAQDLAHKFDGDTLIFSAGGMSSTRDGPYVGPIWAWRPGWPAPRQLAAAGYSCTGHYKVPVAWCVTNALYEGIAPAELDINGGSVAEPVGPPLPKIDRPRVFRKGGDRAFWITFTTAGDAIIYSAPRATDPMTASLRIAKLGDAGVAPPQEILPDVMNWNLSNDEKKVYYLSNFTNRSGALMMADFPTGANPVQIARKTSRYVILGEETAEDRGIGFFVDGTGRFLSDYRVVPDRTQPFASTVVFRYGGSLEGFRPSPDVKYTNYAKYDQVQGFNGYIARNDGSGDCIINSEPDRPAYQARFLDHSGLVFWAEEAYDDSSFRDGWVGVPDGCRDKHRFAARIGFYTPINDEGLVFGDNLDNETVTLRYAKIENNRWPAEGPITVMEKVAMPVIVLGAKENQLLYRVAGATDAESGLYLFSGLPFGAATQ
jgi:hypothetical protein